MRKEVWIGWPSSLIEAYNMAIYSFLVPVFLDFEKPYSILISYSLVFIGLLFYPIGAAYYGVSIVAHFGIIYYVFVKKK